MAANNKKDAGAAREPVTATGADLLKLVADNGGTMYLTQAEGADGVNSGFLTVDTTNVDGDTALVTLTDAGRASINPTTGAPAGSNSYAIDDDVPMPTAGPARRRGEGGYPFETLNVGQSFHVAKTAENPDPATRLASSVSGARSRFAEVIPGETVDFTVRTYKRGDDGKYLKDDDGKRVVDTEKVEQRPKTKLTRDFMVKAVDASDPKGEGARVWRTV